MSAWRYFPEAFTWFNRNFLRMVRRLRLNRAWEIITVSETTKKDLIKYYGVDEKKVVVVHHGFAVENLSADKISEQLPEKYILFLSTLQPRKNLEGLIKPSGS